MGHFISGFIAAIESLTCASQSLSKARVCSLGQGYGFLPLTKELASLDDQSAAIKDLDLLTAPLASWAVEQSMSFPIAYIETEYFGGVGGQSAAVWRDGVLVFGPERTIGDEQCTTPLLDHAINLAMRHLGVVRGDAHDEFGALGLHEHRSNEEWIESSRES